LLFKLVNLCRYEKVVILARECGMDLELSDIPVQSLVPEPLRATESVEEFMAELPKYDEEMTQATAEAAAAGEKLR
jgi:aspartokinase/homoserine dehydrogenase 1